MSRTLQARPRSRRIRGRRYRVALRTFLNKPGFHGKASLIASVEDTSELPAHELRYRRHPEIYLNISDCSSQCTLAFEICTRDEQKNSLYKLDQLLEGIGRFRDALTEEIALYNKRERASWRDL